MSTLNKYTGPWTKHLCAHLLRRTTYGVSYETMVNLSSGTLDQCVNTLLSPLDMPSPPINYSFTSDTETPIGETWVDKATSQGVDAYRNQSLKSWSFELMLKDNVNIREKMTMFWHNHFVIADITDARYNYIYIKLLRKYALGNFKQLTKEITIDPAMLNYLNGRDNTGQAPNENYARELMELFTLGKGTLAGPGDYTTYTEEDVKEVARVLTGWIDVRNSLPIRAEYRAGRHDVRSKTLSHRFGNVTINNAGAEEYKNLIDIIFQKEEVATFIATKIYRWFVQSKIDESTYDNIIIPLAKLIRDNDYEMLSAIKALISSEHFYDECVIGAIIKNPVDFLLNPLNPFKVQLPSITDNRNNPYFGLNAVALNMQMGIFAHPSVAGWTSYYQEPSYYRIWLNATSLPARKNYTDGLAGLGITIGQFKMQLNVIDVIDKIDNPQNTEAIVDTFNWILMAKPLADNQKSALTGLINVGTGGNWQTVYLAYKNNPTEANKNEVRKRLRILGVYMMGMPEYHLS